MYKHVALGEYGADVFAKFKAPLDLGWLDMSDEDGDEMSAERYQGLVYGRLFGIPFNT